VEGFNANNVLFFFGAGASAPFGVPTMNQFVTNFERFLDANAEPEEKELFSDIKTKLEARSHKHPDLEAIFSVIDGIIHYDDPVKIGMFQLYFAEKFKDNFPNHEHVRVANLLKIKFQIFIKDNCVIKEEYYPKLQKVYGDFFRRFAEESDKSPLIMDSWVLFTTNYDLGLENYWCNQEKGIETNFEYNTNKKMSILNSDKILLEEEGKIKLFKLHGSINWQIEGKSNEIVEVNERGSSLLGRNYVGELMLYPIAEKQLYLEPYISMFVRLNRELEKKNTWVVIGYSFNDQVIQEIFLKHCTEKKHLILVHPNAEEILNKKFHGSKAKLTPVKQKFGLYDNEVTADYKPYNYLNHQIMYNVLSDKPKFDADFKPKPRQPVIAFG
jgi:hypothetical protein